MMDSKEQVAERSSGEDALVEGERVLRIVASDLIRYKVEVGDADEPAKVKRKVYLRKADVDPMLVNDWRAKREERAARKEAKRMQRLNETEAPAPDYASQSPLPPPTLKRPTPPLEPSTSDSAPSSRKRSKVSAPPLRNDGPSQDDNGAPAPSSQAGEDGEGNEEDAAMSRDIGPPGWNLTQEVETPPNSIEQHTVQAPHRRGKAKARLKLDRRSSPPRSVPPLSAPPRPEARAATEESGRRYVPGSPAVVLEHVDSPGASATHTAVVNHMLGVPTSSEDLDDAVRIAERSMDQEQGMVDAEDEIVLQTQMPIGEGAGNEDEEKTAVQTQLPGQEVKEGLGTEQTEDKELGPRQAQDQAAVQSGLSERVEKPGTQTEGMNEQSKGQEHAPMQASMGGEPSFEPSVRVATWILPSQTEKESAPLVDLDPNADDAELIGPVRELLAAPSASAPVVAPPVELSSSQAPRESTPPARISSRRRRDASQRQSSLERGAAASSPLAHSASLALRDVLQTQMSPAKSNGTDEHGDRGQDESGQSEGDGKNWDDDETSAVALADLVESPFETLHRKAICRLVRSSALIPGFLKPEVERFVLRHKDPESQQSDSLNQSESETQDDGYLRTKDLWIFELTRVDGEGDSVDVRSALARSDEAIDVSSGGQDQTDTIILYLSSGENIFDVQRHDATNVRKLRANPQWSPWFDSSGQPFVLVYTWPNSGSNGGVGSRSISSLAPSSQEDVRKAREDVAKLQAANNATQAELEQTQARIEGLEKDNDFFKELYNEASQRAVAASSEAEELRSEVEKFKRQLTTGFEAITRTAKAQREQLQEQLRLATGEVKLLRAQNERTNDAVRRKAAEWDAHQAVKAARKRETILFEKRRSERFTNMGNQGPSPSVAAAAGAATAAGASAADSGSNTDRTGEDTPTANSDAEVHQSNELADELAFLKADGADLLLEGVATGRRSRNKRAPQPRQETPTAMTQAPQQRQDAPSPARAPPSAMAQQTANRAPVSEATPQALQQGEPPRRTPQATSPYQQQQQQQQQPVSYQASPVSIPSASTVGAHHLVPQMPPSQPQRFQHLPSAYQYPISQQQQQPQQMPQMNPYQYYQTHRPQAPSIPGNSPWLPVLPSYNPPAVTANPQQAHSSPSLATANRAMPHPFQQQQQQQQQQPQPQQQQQFFHQHQRPH